ncbi:zinc finger protein 250 isoform X2 [Engraulis encrasicolus]|uniref:zinc finger protein 250 isoform X2 n=1 Tax=Engraulis encrasicolus TaxID=184585 RepID=UPI002FD114E3
MFCYCYHMYQYADSILVDSRQRQQYLQIAPGCIIQVRGRKQCMTAPKEFGNVFNYLRKTLGWSDSQQTPDSPEPPVLEKEVLAETDNNPAAAAVTYDDGLPDTPTSLSLSSPTCTSQSDQSLASSGSSSDRDPDPDPATPVQVEVQALPALPEAMRFQLGVEPRDWKLLQPCAVQLVDLHLLTGPSRGHSFPRGSPRPKDLRPHQGLHTGRRLCCFSECGGGVWRVVGSVKAKAKTKAAGGGSSGALACKLCGKTFARRKLLRRHERFHVGEQPYVCHLCRKRFTLRKSLRRHLRFHTGEKPHGCPHCSKCFRLKDSLKAHMRFHTGERPFACTLCPKSFRLQKNLEVHTATH